MNRIGVRNLTIGITEVTTFLSTVPIVNILLVGSASKILYDQIKGIESRIDTKNEASNRIFKENMNEIEERIENRLNRIEDRFDKRLDRFEDKFNITLK
jgi:hypothetical protein